MSQKRVAERYTKAKDLTSFLLSQTSHISKAKWDIPVDLQIGESTANSLKVERA